jgi:hypothetical protein
MALYEKITTGTIEEPKKEKKNTIEKNEVPVKETKEDKKPEQLPPPEHELPPAHAEIEA